MVEYFCRCGVDFSLIKKSINAIKIIYSLFFTTLAALFTFLTCNSPLRKVFTIWILLLCSIHTSLSHQILRRFDA